MMLEEIARTLASGTTTSVRLTDAALAIADSADAAHVFTARLDENARDQAQAADLARRGGSPLPYLGVPVTIKDNFDLAGHATTAGSVVLKTATPAKEDAVAVDRLRRAGFVILGKTSMSEFAFSGLGLNPHYGTPRNPAFTDADRIPGGSSSGAAVSVALGIAPVAVGTDTGGSIRIPAALCGLVGFKPTADRVSRKGVLPLSTTLDSVGVIARSVACCAATVAVMRDAQDAPPAPRPAAGLRLAAIENYVTDGMDDKVSAAYERALRRLVAAGAQVTRLRLPELDDIPAMNSKGTFAAAEAFAWHQDILETGADQYDPRVLARIRMGAAITAASYIRLQERRRQFITALRQRSDGFDAMLAPTVPVIAPTMAELADDDAFHRINLLMLRNPTVVNLMDGCAISLPCHDAGEAPVGLSVIAHAHDDDGLLRMAAGLAPLIRMPG